MASTRKRARGQPSDTAKHNIAVAKRIKPASKLPKRFRALLYGKSNTMKTRTIATLDDVLVVDVNEEGTDSVAKDYDPKVFRVYYWDDINDVYWYLHSGDHPYKAVALDGLTGLAELCMKFVLGDEAARDASRDPDMPSRAVWGKVGELMKTQIINFRNLPMHVVYTALERKKVTGDEEDEDIEVFTGPALSPAIAGTAERAVGLIGYMQNRAVILKPEKKGGKRKRVVRRRMYIGPSETYLTKDRYHLGEDYIEGPHLQEIINSIYGGK